MSSDGCTTRSQRLKKSKAGEDTSADANATTDPTSLDPDEADDYEDAQDDDSVHILGMRASMQSAGGPLQK